MEEQVQLRVDIVYKKGTCSPLLAHIPVKLSPTNLTKKQEQTLHPQMQSKLFPSYSLYIKI